MATEKIFVSSDQIRNCAALITSHDTRIQELLADFEAEMRNVESVWSSEASEEMREAFNALKPSFDKFHRYNEKVCNHLKTNVAEARDTLDAALKSNASNLRRTI